MEGKKLEINCGLCDATGVTGETLAGYAGVEVDCGTMLVTPAANRILLGHGVELNAGSVINLPEGVRVLMKTGSFTLEPGDVPNGPAMLIVTGSLAVREGAGETLDAYAAVHVIGHLTCPQSLAGRVQVTGGQTVYPDGYAYVDGDLTLDKLAAARWTGKKVYTDKSVIVTQDADLDALRTSGTVFACRKAVLPEKLLDKAMPLLELSGDARIVLLPEDTVYVQGNMTLTKTLLRRGQRLWLDGNLAVERREAELLSQLAYLHVAGMAIVPWELEESFSKLDPQCGEVFPYRGELLYERDYVTVDKAYLDSAGFLTLLDCDAVELDGALTDSEIRTGLAIHRCAAVFCEKAQMPAVRSVAENVDYIGGRHPESGEPKDPNTVSIDCGTYTF